MAYFQVNKKPPLSFPSVSGSIVTFNSQYAGLPLKSHTVAVTATQSGSGTPSPSNPRPITGYSAINISHSDADTSNPTVYTINLGGTYYFGEYDARTGVLTVTHERYNLGSFTWGYQSAQTRFYTTGATDIEVPTQYADVADIECEIYEMVNYNQLTGGSTNNQMAAVKIGTNNFISCRDTRYTDPAAYKTAMNGIYVVCKLATPQTIQLPPCPIDTLEGVNNIWADTGDTTLQYPKFG